jgi:hypothetical protein
MFSAVSRTPRPQWEGVMEVDPPVTDLSGEDDSTDLEYADMDDGGVMLVVRADCRATV